MCDRVAVTGRDQEFWKRVVFDAKMFGPGNQIDDKLMEQNVFNSSERIPSISMISGGLW